MIIQFTGYDEKPLYIVKDKILAFGPSSSEGFTSLTVAVGEKSEEWVVHESLEEVKVAMIAAEDGEKVGVKALERSLRR